MTTPKVLLATIILATLGGACIPDRECGVGLVPNQKLQACVLPPPCEGGIINEDNQCVLQQGVETEREEAGGGAGEAVGGASSASTTARDSAGRAGAAGHGGQSGGGAGNGGSAAAAGGGTAGGPGGGSGGAGSAPRCGDGHLDPGELCDGDCPTQCTASSSCVQTKLVGSASACAAECQSSTITACTSGDGCCAMGCTHATDSDCSAKCGDGVVDTDEKCEVMSKTQPCPTSCDDGNACTKDSLVGAAAQCSAECVHMPITAAAGGDGCCAQGANATNDSDCEPKCGNGVVEGNEKCDGDCPAACSASSGCMQQKLVGSAAQCTAVCMPMAITTAVDGDGCCPGGANANIDSDCKPKCGNGMREADEKCDGDCPTTASCSGGAGCARRVLSGSGCDIECNTVQITERKGGDGCCPVGASSTNDTDCKAVCGNGVRDSGETCDGDCPSSCDDGNPCTVDQRLGSDAQCNVACSNLDAERGSACGGNAVCSGSGECWTGCTLGEPKCAGQPGAGSCISGSTWMNCPQAKVCAVTYLPEGANCGAGRVCSAGHACISQ